MFSRIVLFFLLIFFVLSSQLKAKNFTKISDNCFNKIASDSDDLMKNKKIFINLYNLFLNKDIIALKLFNKELSKNKELPKYMLFYFNSLSNYYLGLLMMDESEDKAFVYLDKAKDFIATSLEYNSKFGESLRLASDIYGILIFVNPWLGMFYGPISESYSSQSYIFNSNNPLVYTSLGDGFYYTPFIFGGDKGKAEDMYSKAYNICSLFEKTIYSILSYDAREGEVDKKTCSIYKKHKDAMDIEVFKKTMLEVKKQCSII